MTELCKGSGTGGPDAPNGVAILVAFIPEDRLATQFA